MKHAFRTFAAAAAVSLLSFTAACSEGTGPTQPLGSQAGAARAVVQAVETPRLEPIARFRQKPQVTIAWAKKWIGPQGGRLEFQGFAIDVPAGAVDRVTQFSIRLPVDPKGSEHVVAEFGPHGSRFAVPVGIEFPLRGTSIEGSTSATVVWLNQNAWWDMGGAVTADGARLRTTTDHFSTYGTTTESRGGGMSSSGG